MTKERYEKRMSAFIRDKHLVDFLAQLRKEQGLRKEADQLNMIIKAYADRNGYEEYLHSQTHCSTSKDVTRDAQTILQKALNDDAYALQLIGAIVNAAQQTAKALVYCF